MDGKFKIMRRAVENMSFISLKLIYYGLQLAVGVLVIGMLAYSEFMGSYINEELSKMIINAGVSLFVQFTIGGIVYDIIEKKKG